MRRTTLALAAICLLALTLGCAQKPAEPGGPATPPPAGGRQTPAPEAKETKTSGTIGLSVLTLTNPFFKEIGDVMTAEAKKAGMETIVVSAEFDAAKQLDQVKDFIVRKVTAIVLTPADSKAVGTAIQEANKAGIPVFTCDIASLAPDAKVVCHVATDNLDGGKLAAKAMMEALGNKGKVAIIDYPEVESVILRTKGFQEQLAADKSPIEIVGSWPGKGSKDESFKVAQDILSAHPDVNGIFAINDPSALGACAALEKTGKAGKVIVIGFDGQPEGKKAILEGKIHSDPIQFPDKIASETVARVLRYLDGESVEPEVLIPTSLYGKADAEKDPDLKAQ